MNHEKAIEEEVEKCFDSVAKAMMTRGLVKPEIARHMRALCETIQRAESQRVDTLRNALQQQHEWHLEQTERTPVFFGDTIGQINAEEYQDSALCEITEKALKGGDAQCPRPTKPEACNAAPDVLSEGVPPAAGPEDFRGEDFPTPQPVDTLRQAAQAVVDRWETPLWKDAPHTATFIHALRDALAEVHAYKGVSPDVITWRIQHPWTLVWVACDSFKDGMDKWFNGFNPPYMLTNGVYEGSDSAENRVREFYATSSTPQPVEPAASATPEVASVEYLAVANPPFRGVREEMNGQRLVVASVFARDLEQRLRASEAESEDRLQNAKRLHRNLVHATAERDAALTKTVAIQAQWDAAMSDLKTLEAERAQYREAIKVATDASSKLRQELSPEIHLWPEYQDFADAMDALARISELTPKV